MNDEYKYLELLSRPLDDAQTEVCCRKENTVVAAGAGSGKTQVLATRFAWLLLEDDEIRAPMILTLTFTDKAASEMYERIYRTLEFFSQLKNPCFPEEKRLRAERALKDFAGVHIQTLDSYCGGILRQASNRYGIRPDFSTGSSDSKTLIQDMALQFVLQHRNEKCIKYFAPPAKLQSFATDFFAEIVYENTSLSTKEGYFSSFIPSQVSFLLGEWKRIVSTSGIFSVAQEIHDLLSNMSDSEMEKYPAMKKLFSVTFDENIPEEISCGYEYFSENVNAVCNGIVDFCKWIGNFIGLKCPAKKDCPSGNAVKPLLKELSENLTKLLGIGSYFAQYEYMVDFCELLDQFLSIVNRQKRISGALSFSDVTEMALRILVEQKDIRAQEKNSFSKIMIDEFQDNNGKNRDLLFLLSENYNELNDIENFDSDKDAIHSALKNHLEKEKLFFVGDEKQSIYKFRGADVSVFNELKIDLTAINGPEAYKHMIYNYRSDKELLVTFNQFFGGFLYNQKESSFSDTGNVSFMAKESDATYEALYNEDAITKSVDKTTHELIVPSPLTSETCKAHVAVYVTDDRISAEEKNHSILKSEDQVSCYIARKIEELHSNGVAYSDIAVLDRSRGKRDNLTRWLQYLHIPYILDSQNSIFNDGVVNDVYNFLRLCVYPSDINAFAAFLCSPICGLAEMDMETVLACTHGLNKEVFEAFSDDALVSIESSLGKDSVAFMKYVEASNFYKSQLPLVLSRPVTETLNCIWFEKGYRYETMLNSSVASFAEQYDYLFALFNKADVEGKSISWVIDQLSVYRNVSSFSSDESEMDIKEIKFPMEKEEGVQIMTIHKSKGLQFDYVFLLGLDKAVGSDNSEKLFFSDEYGLTVKPENVNLNYFFEYQRELNKNKNLAEFRRVGYVGVTRAVKEFWIVSKHKVVKTESKEKKTIDVLKPVLFSYYPDFENQMEGVPFFAENAPFDLEKIKTLPRETLFEYSHRVNLDELRKRKISEFNEIIQSQNIKKIDLPEIKNIRINPSMLEVLSDLEDADVGKFTSLEQVLPEIDSVIEGTKDAQGKYRFGYDKLGTLLHSYLEYSAKGMDVESLSSLLLKDIKDLNVAETKALALFCESAVENFIRSSLYEEFKSCVEAKRFHEAEYGFKMNLDSYLFTGIIDLCFENEDGSFTIMDYKTDHSIGAEKYYTQQSCYRKALAEIMGCNIKDIKCKLYFVRYDAFVDITNETEMEIDSVMVENAMKLMEGDSFNE